MSSYEGIRCWCLKFGRPTLEICGEIMPGVGLEPQSSPGRITPLPETKHNRSKDQWNRRPVAARSIQFRSVDTSEGCFQN